MNSGKSWPSLAVHPDSKCGSVMNAKLCKIMESYLNPLRYSKEWIQTGVGCVMAPILFSMMFSAMLMDALQDHDTGLPIRYRFDDNIFNLRRLQANPNDSLSFVFWYFYHCFTDTRYLISITRV